MDSRGECFVNITYTLSFRGVPAKYADALETMIQDDIGTYTSRLSMESVNIVKEPKKAKVNAKP